MVPGSRLLLGCAALLAAACSCREAAFEPVSAAQALGGGACAQTTLGALAQQVREAHPELARAGLEGDLGGDPTSTGWIVAFQRADGGFALTFVLIGPDCGARCRNHRRVYFETDAACQPRRVGEYSFGWSHDAVRCWYAEGTPRWYGQPPLDPARECRTP